MVGRVWHVKLFKFLEACLCVQQVRHATVCFGVSLPGRYASGPRVRCTRDTQYCNDVLKRFQMSDCTPVDTPCEANLHLAASDSPPLDKRKAEVLRNYQQLNGVYMYLTCFTRGDCSFAVNQCARCMSNPGPTHIAAAKRILRYLAGT